MPSTERRQRHIDRRLDHTGGGTTLTGSSGTPAGPAVPAPRAPQGLTITGTKLLFSAVTPMASASLSWRAPVGTNPQRYVVQWATASNFAGAVTRVVGVTSPQTTEIDGLPVNTLIYFRVAAVVSEIQGAWSASVSTTTPADTTPPAAPTSLVTAWSGLTGDLDIRWTNPTSPNFRDVRVRIYASNGGALLREVYSSTGRYTWTRGQHHLDTSGAYDPSVYVVLTARSWGGVFSAADLTGTATLSAPGTPAGLTTSWASDAGTAGANCLITWTQSEAVAGYRLTIDGVARDVGHTGRYDYTLAQNAAEHAGTPDPVLTIALVAVDALGQTSTAANVTATNAAPPATTISAFGAFSSVGLTITPSAALDLRDYRIRVYRNGSLVQTFYTTETRPTYAVEDGNGDYRFDVAARDAFGQHGTASSQTTALTLTDLTAFVAELRAGLIYTDSIGTASGDLAVLKDGNVATNGVTYASGATWTWTMADWGERITHQTSEVAHASTIEAYISYSLDGVTWGYYYGGTPSGGRWQPSTFTATEATAQAGAVSLAAGTWRIDLPQPVPARYIRLHHRNTTNSYTLREFFPSTLLRGTYVQAESITAVELAAGSVVADKIAATAIDGFTITGATVRTAASGARIQMSGSTLAAIDSGGVSRVTITPDGLKTFNSSGVVQVEATTATNGALYVGQGNTRLDRLGVRFIATTSYAYSALDTTRAVTFRNSSDSANIGYLTAADEAGENHIVMHALAATKAGRIELVANSSGTIGNGGGVLDLDGNGSEAASTAVLQAGYVAAYCYNGGTVDIGSILGNTNASIRLYGNVTAPGGLNVGGAAGAAAGQIFARTDTSIASTSTRVLQLDHMTSASPAANFGAGIAIRLEDEGGAARDAAQIVAFWRTTPSGGVRRGALSILAYDQTAARTGLIVSSDGSGAMLGFYGASPLGRQTVTGSRGGNAALTSLLTALANLGLIIDSTS